jgi:hypothetical protein
MKAMKTAVAMPKVQLSKKAQKAAQRYLDGVGISLDRFVSEAVVEWMESTGDVVLDEFARRRGVHAA